MYRKRNVPGSAESLPAFLDQELSNIEQAQYGPVPFVRLEVVHTPPGKVFDGMVVLADGVFFNPGSGAGVYCYRSGAWRFLG